MKTGFLRTFPRVQFRSYRKLLLTFIHSGENLSVCTKAASSLYMSADKEGLEESDFLKAMHVSRQPFLDGIDSNGLIFLEIDAVDFVDHGDHGFLKRILGLCKEVQGIMAVDLGEIMTTPPLKIMASNALNDSDKEKVTRKLVQSLNLEVISRINASAELDQPTMTFKDSV